MTRSTGQNEPRGVVVIGGTGNVGSELLGQLAGLVAQPPSGYPALRVVAVGDEHGIAVEPSGLAPDTLVGLSKSRDIRALERFRDTSPHGLVNQVAAYVGSNPLTFVDVTAAELTDLHLECLRRGHAVVTANKKPVTASMEVWRELMSYGPRRYRFECTCGAGLPVIAPLRDMVAIGDRVLEIQAMVSGSLGQILSGPAMTFGDNVRRAREAGYTEPDPRDDLSGRDVARKALILMRLLGAEMELDDIAAECLFLPEWADLNVDGFMDVLAASDDDASVGGEYMKRLRSRLNVTHNPARYLVDIYYHCGAFRVSVGLQRAAGRYSDFAQLSGPDNMFRIRTEHYDRHPQIIQGPGAGAEVTAAGVLADILNIVH